MKRIGKTLIFNKEISILSSAAVVGPKEGAGPLKEFFDIVEQDSFLGQDSWEKAESMLQKEAIEKGFGRSLERFERCSKSEASYKRIERRASTCLFILNRN